MWRTAAPLNYKYNAKWNAGENMLESKVWTPKSGAPDYVPVTTTNVWETVKNKWESLGSPEAQCPVGQFGAAGSLENEECKRRVAPLWEKFEDVFPDLPEVGPYNNLVDLVPIEEVCALGHYEDPEADIGPVPNLFENPGGLAQKLQEWYLRSLVPIYCEIAPPTAMDGACFCWPYFVNVTFRARSQYTGEWESPVGSTGIFFGPYRGVGVDVSPPNESGQWGYVIYANGSVNPGGIRFGTIHDCQIGVQKYPLASGSGYDDAELISVNSVVPLTPEDVYFYGLGYSEKGPAEDGTCPVPVVAPPLPNYPNTRGFYMPLPVPVISFPVAPGCPLEEDNLNITINLNVDAPPAGEPGPPGKDGKEGYSMLKTIEKTSDEYVQWNVNGNAGERGGVYGLASGTAFVTIIFNVGGVTQSNYRERRVFFEPQYDDFHRKEVGLGNVYLRLSSSEDATAPRMEVSMERMLIQVPDSPVGRNWELVINDKADAGFQIVDLGYRHVLRRVSNADQIPEVEYVGP